MTETPKTEWTLPEAIEVARDAEDAGRFVGLHVALGGSVLHSGWSDKDLDLVVVKHGNQHTKPEDLVALADVLGWEVWEERSYGPDRHTAICLMSKFFGGSKRVDLIAV